MTQRLTHSDVILIRSAKDAKCLVRSPAQTSSPAHAWLAPNRADCTWVTDGDLQTLRPTQLPLRRRTRARPQAISIDGRANRRASAARLCAECSLPPGRQVSCELPQAPGDAQRDLRDQCRASASPREPGLDGSGRRSSRFCQGGRHHRQHDRILSGRRRSVAQPRRSRSL
jgi:hypothetical protein